MNGVKLYTQEDIKCELVAYDSCSTTTVRFMKDKWKQERQDHWINEFKNDYHIKKLIKIEDNIEELIFER